MLVLYVSQWKVFYQKLINRIGRYVMKKLSHYLQLFFNKQYRLKSLLSELSFANYQIKEIGRELKERRESIDNIHIEALDKNSANETDRHEARLREFSHDQSLLRYYKKRKQDIIKKNKLLSLILCINTRPCGINPRLFLFYQKTIIFPHKTSKF